ncbi:MAG: hypothetical protein RIQ60_299 [Pseudomonadota bacterium]|jgi:hypothetical protein
MTVRTPAPAPAPTSTPASATALLALWNDLDPAVDEADYDDWHACEHVPERCTVPGILWGLRYRHTGGLAMPRYLTLYGLADATVLDSAPYQRLLREPTPASRAMRPALRNLSRWVCTLQVATADIHAWAPLVVLALDRQADADRPDVACGLPLWLADRLHDATPLPWLAAGQARASVVGDRLLCVQLPDGSAALPAWRSDPRAARYDRIGGPAPQRRMP